MTTAPTPRGRMSAKRRHHIFWENGGICCVCQVKIDCYGERWIVEHKRALGLLGKDTNPNCAPAHYACAQVKTHTEDLPRIRKAKRQSKALPTPKRPSRSLWRPAGAVYDWKQGRYILTRNDCSAGDTSWMNSSVEMPNAIGN